MHREEPNEISKSGFRRFLCSGLKQQKVTVAGREMLLGSYHQCYRLNGRLIALGVLDLLPRGVSSVYLIYHEDYKSWSWGKLAALREIALSLEAGYHNYYMGV